MQAKDSVRVRARTSGASERESERASERARERTSKEERWREGECVRAHERERARERRSDTIVHVPLNSETTPRSYFRIQMLHFVQQTFLMLETCFFFCKKKCPPTHFPSTLYSLPGLSATRGLSGRSCPPTLSLLRALTVTLQVFQLKYSQSATTNTSLFMSLSYVENPTQSHRTQESGINQRTSSTQGEDIIENPNGSLIQGGEDA